MRVWVMTPMQNVPNHLRITLYAKVCPDMHVLTNCTQDFIKTVGALVNCLEQLDQRTLTETSLETCD